MAMSDCTHDESYCEHCGGEGVGFEDRFSYDTGHYTVDTTCGPCGGKGRVACAVCSDPERALAARCDAAAAAADLEFESGVLYGPAYLAYGEAFAAWLAVALEAFPADPALDAHCDRGTAETIAHMEAAAQAADAA
jgi:hypothetical protein